MAGVVASLAAVGCSGGVDIGALEQQIAADLSSDLSARFGAVSVDQVNCPPVVFGDDEESVTVLCSAELEGQSGTVEVTVSSLDRTAVAVFAERLIDTSSVERLVAERFAADLSIPTGVDCPGAIAVVPVGGDLRCTALDVRGIERPLVVTVGPSEELTIRLG